jgi:hypothetical protein
MREKVGVTPAEMPFLPLTSTLSSLSTADRKGEITFHIATFSKRYPIRCQEKN